MRRQFRTALEWVLVIVGALLFALVVQTFLFQAFVIPSASMEPTLVNRDRVVVNKLSYNSGPVSRGDVVVFDRPPGAEMQGIDDLIKRVVAVGGETVWASDGRVIVDGSPLIEPYLPDSSRTEDFDPVEVPSGHVFVMGDNRRPAMSLDSRFFGPIDEDLILGRAFVRVWPPNRIGWL